MENIIFNELKTRGYNTDVGVVALSETNKTGKQSAKQSAKQSGKYGRKADIKRGVLCELTSKA